MGKSYHLVSWFVQWNHAWCNTIYWQQNCAHLESCHERIGSLELVQKLMLVRVSWHFIKFNCAELWSSICDCKHSSVFLVCDDIQIQFWTLQLIIHTHTPNTTTTLPQAQPHCTHPTHTPLYNFLNMHTYYSTKLSFRIPYHFIHLLCKCMGRSLNTPIENL